MIHISSNRARQKLPAAETAADLLRRWPELFSASLASGSEGCLASNRLLSKEREGEKEIREERRGRVELTPVVSQI